MKKDHPLIQLGLLLLMVFSFFLNHFQDYDILLKRFAPDYCRAKIGIQILEAGFPLNYSDEGGKEISAAFSNWFVQRNHLTNAPKDLRAESIRFAGGVGSPGNFPDMMLYVTISTKKLAQGSSNVVSWNLPTLKEEIEKLKTKRISTISLYIFTVSAILEVIFLWPKLLPFLKGRKRPLAAPGQNEGNSQQPDSGSY